MPDTAPHSELGAATAGVSLPLTARWRSGSTSNCAALSGSKRLSCGIARAACRDPTSLPLELQRQELVGPGRCSWELRAVSPLQHLRQWLAGTRDLTASGLPARTKLCSQHDKSFAPWLASLRAIASSEIRGIFGLLARGSCCDAMRCERADYPARSHAMSHFTIFSLSGLRDPRNVANPTFAIIRAFPPPHADAPCSMLHVPCSISDVQAGSRRQAVMKPSSCAPHASRLPPRVRRACDGTCRGL